MPAKRNTAAHSTRSWQRQSEARLGLQVGGKMGLHWSVRLNGQTTTIHGLARIRYQLSLPIVLLEYMYRLARFLRGPDRNALMIFP